MAKGICLTSWQNSRAKILSLFHFEKKDGPGSKRIQELSLTTSMHIVAAIHEAAQVGFNYDTQNNNSVKKYSLLTSVSLIKWLLNLKKIDKTLQDDVKTIFSFFKTVFLEKQDISSTKVKLKQT